MNFKNSLLPQKRTTSCKNCFLFDICLPKNLLPDEVILLETILEKADSFRKDDYIFHSHTPTDFMCMVKSGAVKTLIASNDGYEQIVGFHYPGDIFGFDAFAAEQHACDAKALCDSTICKLNISRLLNMDHSTANSLCKQILHYTSEEVVRSQHLALSLGKMTVKQRLATFLVNISRRNADCGFSETTFLLPMSRSDLANFLGMALETLSRITGQLQQQGIISLEHKLCTIYQMPQLIKLTEYEHPN